MSELRKHVADGNCKKKRKDHKRERPKVKIDDDFVEVKKQKRQSSNLTTVELANAQWFKFLLCGVLLSA